MQPLLRVLIALLLLCIAPLPVYLRCLHEANQHLSVAREAVFAQKIPQAIQQYREALRWHAPGNPYSIAAIQELTLLSQADSAPRLEPAQRRYALEQLLSGASASRSSLFSRGAIFEDLVSLAGERLRDEFQVPPPELSEAIAEAPTGWPLIAAHVFFAAWLVVVLATIWRSFTATGQVRGGTLSRGAVVSATLYFCWLAALWLA
jgi:hypothetical protein